MDITYAVENAHDENILTHDLPLEKEVSVVPSIGETRVELLIALVFPAILVVHAVAADAGAASGR